MIDFRYHLVSLISVFLALAVGIVLGAGPLQGPIGTSLQSQVEALRTDRDELRVDLERAGHDIERFEEFISASAPDLLAGHLDGTTVTVVIGAGANADWAAAVSGRLAAAGAQVAVELQLADTALTAEDAQALATALREIDPSLPADDVLALPLALARALAVAPASADDEDSASEDEADGAQETAEDEDGAGGTDESAEPEDGRYTQEEAAVVLAEFTAAGRVSGGEHAPSDAIVLIAPAVPDLPESADDAASAEPDPSAIVAPDYAQFAADMSALTPTVVTGSTAAAERGLIGALRADGAELTTVDGLELSSGPVITALAVATALPGRHSAYGFADSADSVLPEAAQ